MTKKTDVEIPEPIESTSILIETAANTQRLIYCGPDIPGGALRQFTVFKGGYPEHLKGLMEDCPAVKELMVPVEELSNTRQQLGKSGSRASQAYSEIVRHFAQKGGN